MTLTKGNSRRKKKLLTTSGILLTAIVIFCSNASQALSPQLGLKGESSTNLIQQLVDSLHEAGLISDSLAFEARNSERVSPGLVRLLVLDVSLRAGSLDPIDLHARLTQLRQSPGAAIVDEFGPKVVSAMYQTRSEGSAAPVVNALPLQVIALESGPEEDCKFWCNWTYVHCVVECVDNYELCLRAFPEDPWACYFFALLCVLVCTIEWEACMAVCQNYEDQCGACQIAQGGACLPWCLLGELVCEESFEEVCVAWGEVCRKFCRDHEGGMCEKVCTDTSTESPLISTRVFGDTSVKTCQAAPEISSISLPTVRGVDTKALLIGWQSDLGRLRNETVSS